MSPLPESHTKWRRRLASGPGASSGGETPPPLCAPGLLRRHPWLLLVALTLAGMAASIAMVTICSRHAPESVPVDPAAARP